MTPAGRKYINWDCIRMDKRSYALGMNVGINLLQSGVTKVAYCDFNRGMKHMLSSVKPEITEAEMSKILTDYFNECIEEAKNQMKKRNQDWLNENAFKNGTTTYPSGLQIKILSKGGEKHATDSSEIVCNYEAKLIDGRVVDSTYTKGKPTKLSLNKVITGFREGVKLIGEGGKAEFALPSNLAYGEKGLGKVVPPFATLIYTVEILKID